MEELEKCHRCKQPLQRNQKHIWAGDCVSRLLVILDAKDKEIEELKDGRPEASASVPNKRI